MSIEEEIISWLHGRPIWQQVLVPTAEKVVPHVATNSVLADLDNSIILVVMPRHNSNKGVHG